MKDVIDWNIIKRQFWCSTNHYVITQKIGGKNVKVYSNCSITLIEEKIV